MNTERDIEGASAREGGGSATLEELLRAQREQIALLEARLAVLEGRGRSTSPARDGDHDGDDADRPLKAERTNRRAFLRLAGVAATGLAASAVVADRAAAAPTQLLTESSNAATAMTSLTNSGTSGIATAAFNGVGPANSNGVWGVSNGSTGAGVLGSSDTGYGVIGSTSVGYDLYAGGNGRLGFVEHLTSGAPTSGNYGAGDMFRNAAGDLYVCVTAGAAPSTAVFRKVAGPATAGALHILPSPVRVYDSRPSAQVGPVGTGDGPILLNATRLVSLTNGYVSGSPTTAVPVGAVAAVVSIAIVNTVNTGRIGIHSGAVAWPGNSSINWFGSGQILNATTMSAIDSSARIGVTCGGTSTDFVIDVVGYYR